MFQTETIYDVMKGANCFLAESCQKRIEITTASEENFLEIALDLLEQGCAQEADALLTAALLENPDDENLWFAAGLSRLRRGAVRAAAAAFKMAAWLSDDPLIREILSLLDEISR
jgi:Tfp pilus assembly protein PilF